jgi:hypothetical protein
VDATVVRSERLEAVFAKIVRSLFLEEIWWTLLWFGLKDLKQFLQRLCVVCILKRFGGRYCGSV